MESVKTNLTNIMSKPDQYYSQQFPEEGELVLVQFISRNDTYFTAKLVEYDLDGLMNCHNVTKKRRIASWSQYVFMDKVMVARVEDVDEDKENVQISLAYLSSEKDQRSINEIQSSLMTYFTENKAMENFVKSLCITHNFDYNTIWTTLVHHIDELRREYNQDEKTNISIWKYFNDNIANLDDWASELELESTIVTAIKELHAKKTHEGTKKITSRIGIISLNGIDKTKQMLKKVFDGLEYKFSFRYDTTPYYLFETTTDDSSPDLHTFFIEQLKSSAKTSLSKIFIKTDFVAKLSVK
jgi:translation initiation factor 2 alpha subunit (eIF-2alpha)